MSHHPRIIRGETSPVLRPKWVSKRPLPMTSPSPRQPLVEPLHRITPDSGRNSPRSNASWQTADSDVEESPGPTYFTSPRPKAGALSEALRQSCGLAEQHLQRGAAFTDEDHRRLAQLCRLMGHPAPAPAAVQREESGSSSAGSVASQVAIRDLQRRVGSPMYIKKTARAAEVILGFLASLIARLSDPPALHSHLLAHAPRILDADEVALLLAGGDGVLWDVATGATRPATGVLGYAWTTGQAVNLSAGSPMEPRGSAYCVVPLPGRGLLTAVREGGACAPVPFHEDEFELLRTVGRLLAAADPPPPRHPLAPATNAEQLCVDQCSTGRFPNIPPASVRRVLDLPVLEPELARLRTTHFDVHAYSELPDAPLRLLRLLVAMFEDLGLIDSLQLDVGVLVQFLIRTQALYNAVRYHNFVHAFDVTQMAFIFIHRLREEFPLTPLEQFVWLIAAVLHDVGHEGLNNAFNKRSNGPLGLLADAVGTGSVMEMHHCHLAVEILRDPESNVFHMLSREATTDAYQLLLTLIMATDMALHNDITAKFKAQEDPPREIVFMMLMKSCDLCNTAKPFPMARRWAKSVMEEFWTQGDLEKVVGLDVLPMFDRDQRANVVQFQVGFIDAVAKAHFSTMAEWAPCLWDLADNVAKNREMWLSGANVEE